METKQPVNFTIELIRAQIRAALIFAADKDIRYFLNGICLHVGECGDARLIGCDGHRMAVVKICDESSATPGDYPDTAPDISAFMPRTKPRAIIETATGGQAFPCDPLQDVTDKRAPEPETVLHASGEAIEPAECIEASGEQIDSAETLQASGEKPARPVQSKAPRGKKYEFRAATVDAVKKMGAYPGGAYAWQMATRAGVLNISPYDDWIACRFDDVARAKECVKVSSLNPFSGKWNFHYATRPQQANLNYFLAALHTIMQDDETEAEFTSNEERWLNMTADEVREMPEETYRNIYDIQEDKNAHSANMVMEAKRYGSAADVQEAESILEAHYDAGALTVDLIARRDNLSASIAQRRRRAGLGRTSTPCPRANFHTMPSGEGD